MMRKNWVANRGRRWICQISMKGLGEWGWFGWIREEIGRERVWKGWTGSGILLGGEQEMLHRPLLMQYPFNRKRTKAAESHQK